MPYPAITPPSRRFVPPKWPTKAFVSQAGTTTRRLYGNKPAQADLQLTYRNVTDDQASAILEHYQSLKGPMNKAVLPSETWDGASTSLSNQIDISDYADIDWYFAAAPIVDNVFPGISTVQVKFIGEIRN